MPGLGGGGGPSGPSLGALGPLRPDALPRPRGHLSPALGVLEYRVLGTNFRDYAIVFTQLEAQEEAFSTVELYSECAGLRPLPPASSRPETAQRPCACVPAAPPRAQPLPAPGPAAGVVLPGGAGGGLHVAKSLGPEGRESRRRLSGSRGGPLLAPTPARLSRLPRRPDGPGQSGGPGPLRQVEPEPGLPVAAAGRAPEGL